MQKRLKAQVEMSRASDGNWYLRAKDEASGNLIVEMVLGVEQFGDLLSTRMVDGVPVILYEGNDLGKQMENQMVVIPGLGYDNWDERDVTVSRYLTRFYPDWTPDNLGDRINYHRVTTDGGYQIVIRRWVETDDGE